MLTEGSYIELKENLNDKFERSVIGFLNTNGGNLYIGVADNGFAVGLKNLDSIMLQVKNRIRDSISPSTLGLFEINVEEIDEKKIINITIARGNERPYYLKSKGMSPEGCYIRVGNATEKMPSEMITMLFSKRTRNSPKNISSPNQNLSFSELKILYNESGYEIGENLFRQLDLINDDGRYNYIAYLMSDNNTLSFKVSKYSGSDTFDLIESEEFGNGCLIKITKNILSKLNVENKTYTKITVDGREEIKMIEPIALKEAVINAIVHNDYSNEYPPKFELFDDRLEISSTGGLPENFTSQDFLGGFSAPRNKELMRIFNDLRLVEHLGTGVRRILKFYNSDIFEFYPNFLRVTFKFRKNNFEKTKNEKKKIPMPRVGGAILEEIRANPYMTIKELAEKIKVSERTILRYTSKLVEHDFLIRYGSKKNGYWEINE